MSKVQACLSFTMTKNALPEKGKEGFYTISCDVERYLFCD